MTAKSESLGTPDSSVQKSLLARLNQPKYLGAHEVLLAIELRFRSSISALEVREAVARMRRETQAQNPDVTRIFFGAESISGDDGPF